MVVKGVSTFKTPSPSSKDLIDIAKSLSPSSSSLNPSTTESASSFLCPRRTLLLAVLLVFPPTHFLRKCYLRFDCVVPYGQSIFPYIFQSLLKVIYLFSLLRGLITFLVHPTRPRRSPPDPHCFQLPPLYFAEGPRLTPIS